MGELPPGGIKGVDALCKLDVTNTSRICAEYLNTGLKFSS